MMTDNFIGGLPPSDANKYPSKITASTNESIPHKNNYSFVRTRKQTRNDDWQTNFVVGKSCRTPLKYGTSLYELAQTKVYLTKNNWILFKRISKHKMMNDRQNLWWRGDARRYQNMGPQYMSESIPHKNNWNLFRTHAQTQNDK